MALTVQFLQNQRAKLFVPNVKADKLLQYRRGKREGVEAPVSNNQTQLRCIKWASRREVVEPNPSREIKTSGANGSGS